MTNAGNSGEKEMVHWYGRRQGVFNTFYGAGKPDEGPMTAGKWINYDYIFDKTDMTMDIYMNGYPVVKGKDISSEISQITGLNQLNFQVRDMNIEGDSREVNVYVDDIKVTYGTTAPVVSPYAVFGDAAKVEGSKYVSNEMGVVYNYGQSLSDMKKCFSDKNVFLVVEKWDSEQDSRWNQPTDSLESVILKDGRVVNPVLCVEDGNFFYCYDVVQTMTYDKDSKTAAILFNEDRNAAIIFAGYKDGVLTMLDLQNAELKRGVEKPVTANESFDTANLDEIRIMIWDSVGNMTPLSNGLRLNLK